MSKDIEPLLPFLKTILAAIEKAVGPDLKHYLSISSNRTNNAIIQLRGDFINTNLSKMLESGKTNLKLFKRFSWVGCLLIDDELKITLSITTKQNLFRIQNKKKTNHPHYLASLCFVENRNIEVVDTCPLFPEMEDNTIYEKDYFDIVGDNKYIDEDYHHYILAYSSADFHVTDAVLLLLDRNLDVVQEEKLGHLIEPDFADLTVEDDSEVRCNDVVVDSHNLITIKPELLRNYSIEPEKNPAIDIHSEDIIPNIGE